MADAVPPELLGVWRGEDRGDLITMTIREGTYQLNRAGSAGAGKVAVVDDVIELFDSNQCPGTGRYTWSLDGTALTLTPVERDACPGRRVSLEDVAFTFLMAAP
jgi:hypothetical protein